MARPDARLDDLLTGDPPRLEPLLRWLLTASPVHALDGEPRRTTRLRRLQAALLERGLTGPLSEAWNHTSAIRLLAETGLPDRTSLVGEGFLRVVDRIIPRLDPEGDLYALLDRLELNNADAAWIEGLPEDLRTYWGSLCSPPLEAWVQAARLLAHRAAAVGLSRDLLSLDPGGSDADSPFFNLSRAVRERGERPRDPEARVAGSTAGPNVAGPWTRPTTGSRTAAYRPTSCSALNCWKPSSPASPNCWSSFREMATARHSPPSWCGGAPRSTA